MVVPVFLYDGDCAFCSSCARFIQRHIAGPSRVQAWQLADLSALGLTSQQCDSAVQWVDRDHPGRAGSVSGPAAISALLRASTQRRWRSIGTLLGLRAVLALAWPAYRWVARHRDRMPGGTAACALPAARRHPNSA